MSSTRHQFKFFQVLGTALTLAIIGACSSSDSDESTSGSVPSLTITNAPSINIANARSYGVSGTCIGGQGEQNPVLKVVLGLHTLGSPACEDGEWAVSAHDVSGIEDSNSLKLTVTEGEEEVSQTLIKDTAKPVLELNTPAIINGINQNNYGVSGTCSDVGQDVVVNIGELETSVNCTGDGWSLEGYDVSSLATGSVSLSVNMKDAVGNPANEVSVSVVRDVIAPTLTITTSDLNINAANVGAYTLTGSCEGTTNVTITIGTLDAVTVSCSNTSWTLPSKNMNTLPDGQNIPVLITQDDAAGNNGSLSKALNKDVIAPNIAMTSSLLVSSSNVNSFPMAGTCDENGTGVVSITIAGGTATLADCQGGNWQKSVNLSTEAQGNISVRITHQDALGNRTTITPILNKDIVAPTLTITSPAMMNSANQNAYTIRGTCDENGTLITVRIDGQSNSLSFTCASSAWQVSGDFASLTDNAQIGVTVSVQDGHGNRSEKTASFAKETTLPEVTINTLTELTEANKATFPLTGSCNENNSDVVVSANTRITPTPQPTCQGSAWTTNIDLSTLGGDITIRAHQVDDAGNRGDAPVKIIRSKRKTFLHSKIASGKFHSCALSSGGGVKCWGRQLYGRLGNNSVVSANILYPVDVVGPDTDSDSSGDSVLGNIVQISAGYGHTCALNSSGNVLCWGGGVAGQLGNNATNDSSFPVQVVGPDAGSDNIGDGILDNIVQISGGVGHTCALNSSGNVLCWGNNHNGQLGDDSTINRSYPAFVVDRDGSTTSLSGVVQLSAGDNHTCVLTSTETVLCWGDGAYGTLGSSSEIAYNVIYSKDVGVYRDAPLAVLTQQGGSLLSGIAQVASGYQHTCALTLDRHVKCWGRSEGGALGDNGVVTADQSWFPVDVVGEDTDGNGSGDGLLSNIVQITLGLQYACALNAQGKAWCWGQGEFGKLGTGSTDNKNYPVSVIAGSGSSSSLSRIVEIVSHGWTTCALSEEGRVLRWGEGGYGVLGYGGTSDQSSPVTVIPASGSTDFFNIGTYRGSYACEDGTCAFDPIGLSLATTSSSPSTGASPSIEVSGIGTGKTLNLYSRADCTGSSEGTASSPSGTIALSGLSEGAYKYYFDITDNLSNRSGCSKSFISYIYDSTAPSTPSLSFTTASGSDTTPDISVSGITPGDLVRVYSDSGCTTLAAPATRVDGVSRSITLNEISGVAAHDFYATATDAAGNVSDCSAGATYTLTGGL